MAVVCISCSGMLIEPQPTFSWVWNLSFLNMVTFQATITSPRCRLPAGALIGLLEDLEHLERDAQVGIGVVVDVGARDVGLAFVPVQAVDVVLHALVDVDRLLVDQQGSGEQVDLAEHAVSVAGGVDDDDVLRRPRCAG